MGFPKHSDAILICTLEQPGKCYNVAVSARCCFRAELVRWSWKCAIYTREELCLPHPLLNEVYLESCSIILIKFCSYGYSKSCFVLFKNVILIVRRLTNCTTVLQHQQINSSTGIIHCFVWWLIFHTWMQWLSTSCEECSQSAHWFSLLDWYNHIS